MRRVRPSFASYARDNSRAADFEVAFSACGRLHDVTFALFGDLIH
jgi:hypothetical protein